MQIYKLDKKYSSINKNFISFFVFSILLLIILTVFNNPTFFYQSIINTLKIWLMKVFPSLFTFYIISSALINFNILNKISFVFLPIKKLFKINFESNEAFNIFILSFLNGNPSTILFINQNLNNNLITKNDATILLKCASFISPLFIVSFFNNSKTAYILIFSHFLSNLLYCSFLTRKTKKNNFIKKNNQIDINNFLLSIKNYIPTQLMIASMMILCNIIKFSLTSLLIHYNLNNLFFNIIFTIIELSTGLNDLLNLNLTYKLLIIISAFLISFGGLCLHLQVYNCLDKNLKYKDYFYARIIQSILCILLIKIWLYIK